MIVPWPPLECFQRIPIKSLVAMATKLKNTENLLIGNHKVQVLSNRSFKNSLNYRPRVKIGSTWGWVTNFTYVYIVKLPIEF